MEISFDPAKNAANIAKHGLPFQIAGALDWSTALVVADLRHEYPESRYTAIGLIAKRAHVVVFTPTSLGIRVISFRKANPREVQRYEEARRA
jgi:uncharacterized DUF497 family protein